MTRARSCGRCFAALVDVGRATEPSHRRRQSRATPTAPRRRARTCSRAFARIRRAPAGRRQAQRHPRRRPRRPGATRGSDAGRCKLGADKPAVVSAIDADGNERAGIALPVVAVPVAAYTGWNPRRPIPGLPDVLYEFVGSRLPLLSGRDAYRRGTSTRWPSAPPPPTSSTAGCCWPSTASAPCARRSRCTTAWRRRARRPAASRPPPPARRGSRRSAPARWCRRRRDRPRRRRTPRRCPPRTARGSRRRSPRAPGRCASIRGPPLVPIVPLMQLDRVERRLRHRTQARLRGRPAGHEGLPPERAAVEVRVVARLRRARSSARRWLRAARAAAPIWSASSAMRRRREDPVGRRLAGQHGRQHHGGVLHLLVEDEPRRRPVGVVDGDRVVGRPAPSADPDT